MGIELVWPGVLLKSVGVQMAGTRERRTDDQSSRVWYKYKFCFLLNLSVVRQEIFGDENFRGFR